MAQCFEELAQRQPEKACFVIGERQLSFGQALEVSQKVAGYFQERGLKRGDCVALLMETRVEYVCIWLGLSQLGVITALINSHLRGDSLLHCIRVAKACALIVGSELTDVLQSLPALEQPIYQFSDSEQQIDLLPGATDLSGALAEQKPLTLARNTGLSARDKLLYVYTSGTTGLPKAAVITNLRFLFMSAGTFYMLRLSSDDIVYNSLPLYHTAGGIVGVGNALLNGCTVVMRKKFSASNFWSDCSRHKCTVAQYIGELCRYLLATPYKNSRPEQLHQLRLMYGNGLRPQIWTQFVSRFSIPQIGEIYGATEGNSNLINITSRIGAIGFVPIFGINVYPVQILRCDELTGEPLRNAKGNCMRCAAGEPGLLVGQVDARRAVSAFHGYADKSASEQKLLRNVFRKGDCYFNSGDMVVSDILGYFYFKDRTGDTFRWRGENVATQEVEAIITNCIGLSDCVVYGVQVSSRCPQKEPQYPLTTLPLPLAGTPCRGQSWNGRHSGPHAQGGHGLPVDCDTRQSASLCASAVHSPDGRDSSHCHLQADEARVGAGGIQPGDGQGPHLLPQSGRSLPAAHRGAVRCAEGGRGWTLGASTREPSPLRLKLACIYSYLHTLTHTHKHIENVF